MSFADDLKAAQEAVMPHKDVPVLLNGNRHVLRFRRMNGLLWAAESDKHPARPEVLIDSRYGYNLRGLIMAVAPLCGVRVDGDEDVKMEPAEWAELFQALDGAAFQRVTDAIWELNEYGPQMEVEAAGKARPAGRKKSP